MDSFIVIASGDYTSGGVILIVGGLILIKTLAECFEWENK